MLVEVRIELPDRLITLAATCFRLEQMGEILGKKLTGKTCAGMKGVLEEGLRYLKKPRKDPCGMPP
jgi:ferritin-like metal-binding protein YciE